MAACAASPQPGQPRVGDRALVGLAGRAKQTCIAHPSQIARIDMRAPRRFSDARKAFDAGLARQKDGAQADALEAFKEAVAADPTFGLAHLEAGISHLYVDNAEKQMAEHLAAAVVLLPENPRAHLHFARIQREVGADKVAEVHYGCALALSPSSASAHEAFARFLFERGRVDEAERRARSAVALKPGESTYRVLLADILTQKERWLEAAVEVEEAATQIKRSAALFRRAATLYARGGSEADARRMRSVADRIDPPPKPRKLRPLLRR